MGHSCDYNYGWRKKIWAVNGEGVGRGVDGRL